MTNDAKSGVVLRGGIAVNAPTCGCGYQGMSFVRQPTPNSALFECRGLIGNDKPCMGTVVVCIKPDGSDKKLFWDNDLKRPTGMSLLAYARMTLGDERTLYGFSNPT